MRALLIAALGASGCLSMNTFESARTLDAGEVSHSISLTSFVNPQQTLAPVPMPAYSVSVGVARDFELGAMAGLPGRLRLMAKYNPVRTEWFDAAIAPGAWIALAPHEVDNESHALILGADLPVVLDLNLGPVTIVPFAGPGVAYSPNGHIAGLIVRTGLGVRIQLGKSVRLHPEVSTVIDPVRGEPIDYAAGIAVGLGADAHID